MEDNLALRPRGIAVLLVAASLLLALGVTLPILRVERLIFFSRDSSLIGIAWDLASSGELLLGLVVAVFSVLFPAAKIVFLAQLVAQAGPHRFLRRHVRFVEALGRWSMMDVLVVALVVFSVKASGLATATTQPGLYCFVGAVLATMLAARGLARGEEIARQESR